MLGRALTCRSTRTSYRRAFARLLAAGHLYVRQHEHTRGDKSLSRFVGSRSGRTYIFHHGRGLFFLACGRASLFTVHFRKWIAIVRVPRKAAQTRGQTATNLPFISLFPPRYP